MTRRLARSAEAIELARGQRRRANEFADTVWQWVRNRQVAGQKFRREYPIPPYTADFCCASLKLVLEIDGADHFTADGQERDRARDEFLAAQGYRVVRSAGYQVSQEGRRVIERIDEEVKKRMRGLGN
jgi:very-short-patch-repair endonuclease